MDEEQADDKLCVVCGDPIPSARAEIVGKRVLTCSPPCRRENDRRQSVERSRRWRAQRKEQGTITRDP